MDSDLQHEMPMEQPSVAGLPSGHAQPGAQRNSHCWHGRAANTTGSHELTLWCHDTSCLRHASQQHVFDSRAANSYRFNSQLLRRAAIKSHCTATLAQWLAVTLLAPARHRRMSWGPGGELPAMTPQATGTRSTATPALLCRTSEWSWDSAPAGPIAGFMLPQHRWVMATLFARAFRPDTLRPNGNVRRRRPAHEAVQRR